MTVLKFNGYTVKEMGYRNNPNFKKKKNISLTPEIQSNNEINDNKIIVNLSVKAGSISDESMPFEVTCSVQGKFEYNPDEDTNKVGVDTFIRNNSVAILYPYVRAIIATLTTTSNEFPGYNMPTINVAEILRNNNSSNK